MDSLRLADAFVNYQRSRIRPFPNLPNNDEENSTNNESSNNLVPEINAERYEQAMNQGVINQARNDFQEYVRDRAYQRYLESVRESVQSPLSPRRFHQRELVRKKKIAKKTVSKHQIQSNYIGLKHLAFCLGWRANNMIEQCSESWKDAAKIAKDEFEIARLIDPSNDYVNSEGIMWEELGIFDKAEEIYLIAIEQGEDTLAMFNLGDLYEKNVPIWPCSKSHLAIKYFEMAAQLGDPKSISKSILHYFKAFEETERNVGYLILKLAEYFVIMVEQEEIAKSMNYPIDKFDRYINCGLFPHEFQYRQFNDFVERQTNLVMMLELENMRNNFPKDHKYQLQINKYLKSLHKLEDYQAYKNKMKLFTQLNNITECPICIEEKVNIDIWCGHTFCGDCYARIYKKECPLCRTSCGFRTHHKTV